MGLKLIILNKLSIHEKNNYIFIFDYYTIHQAIIVQQLILLIVNILIIKTT